LFNTPVRFGIELSGIMLALIFATSVTVFDVKAQSVRTQNSSSSKSASILNAAKQSVGKQMWKGYGLSDGALGCAASLSSVLKVAGVKYATSVRTKEVRAKLLKGPDHATEYDIRKGATDSIDDARLAAVAQPGDILVAFMDSFPRCSVGPRAHCGIIGANGTVYTNDWNNGIWTHGSIHTYFDSYKYIRVIRLR
jgi:hypothetical protein